MGNLLLVGHPKFSWREWLQKEVANRPLIILDPANADYGAPARLFLVENGKVRSWHFAGSIDPNRCPIPLLSGAIQLLKRASEDAVVQLFSARQSPFLRQLSMAISQIVDPEKILVPDGSHLEKQTWLQSAEKVELPAPIPPLVKDAQIKSRWIEMIESGEDHVVELADVAIEGLRLGSGTRLAHKDFEDYGEVSAGVLHVVTNRNIPDAEIGRVMDIAHARRLNIIDPTNYSGLICSFSHANGLDFGFGVIRSFDPQREVFHVRCQAVAPAPVKVFKVGSIRITDAGQELETPMAWTL